jgi:hypothetical protein
LADKFKQLAISDQTDDNADGAPSNRSQSVLGLLEAPKHDEAALAKTDDDDDWVEVDGERRAKRKLQPVPMQPGASTWLGTEELQPSLKKATERAIAEMEDARKDEADFLDADRPFAFLGRKEQHNMEKVFDYEDRMLVDVETGEVTMKWYYMHPGRYKKVWDEKEKEYVLKFVYCGCYFASALWDEYQNAKGQSKWKCEVDWERVQQCFPKDYEMVNKQYGKLLSSEKMGTCGQLYRPFKDGASNVVEIKVDDDWYPFVTEMLPEVIVNRFKKAQAEWYRVSATSQAEEVRISIFENQTHPRTNVLSDVPLNCMAKFPLKEYYEAGGKPITAVQWVKYFYQVAQLGTENDVALFQLSKACDQFLKKNPEMLGSGSEYLPDSLSRGTTEVEV